MATAVATDSVAIARLCVKIHRQIEAARPRKNTQLIAVLVEPETALQAFSALLAERERHLKAFV